MCNGEQWSAMLDKYHRRRVHEVRVRCWHKGNSCEWVGELNEIEKHAASCEHRLWKCKYCGLRCEFVEGEGKHWPKCTRFPEPCPNSCEVGSVERCNMEQHRSVCSLKPVPCEMKEFGCSVVVPRRELATHMKESELQHLTAMTMLNLCLTKQLQQDSTERDKKITQLREDFVERDKKIVQLQEDSIERDKKITQLQQKVIELKELHTLNSNLMMEELMKLNMRFDEQVQLINNNFDDMRTDIIETMQTELTQQVATSGAQQGATSVVQQGATGGAQQGAMSGATGRCVWSGTEFITIYQYSILKGSERSELSDSFYTHYEGYRLRLLIHFYGKPYNDLGAKLRLIHGEYDEQLKWPVKIKVRFKVLNQADDQRSVVKVVTCVWGWLERGTDVEIHNCLMKYKTLERANYGVQYMMNDCLKFKISVTIL